MTNRRTFLTGASALMTRAAFPNALVAFNVETKMGSTTKPKLLSVQEMQTLEALVDVILPETDSPAASVADTHIFVDAAAFACATEAEQTTLRRGLRDLEANANEAHEKSFAEISADDQVALLKPRAETDMKLAYSKSFFKILKDYTLVGYFHSEIGATQALAYEQIPGQYEADVELSPGQKAWAI